MQKVRLIKKGCVRAISGDEVATYSLFIKLIDVSTVAEFLDGEAETDSVTNLLDAHVIKHIFIQLEDILAVDVVFAEQFLVLSTSDAVQEFSHLVLGPLHNDICGIFLAKF